MIYVRTENPDMIHIKNADIHGGREILISLSDEMIDNMKWITEYRNKLDQEIELRSKNPALANAWDQYQTMLRIVMDYV